jgi:hypothetical protein
MCSHTLRLIRCGTMPARSIASLAGPYYGPLLDTGGGYATGCAVSCHIRHTEAEKREKMTDTRNTRGENAPTRTTRRQWSRRALAYQSATSLARLTGEARDQALERHFEQFPPTIATI